MSYDEQNIDPVKLRAEVRQILAKMKASAV
jgi:hypothetical protein